MQAMGLQHLYACVWIHALVVCGPIHITYTKPPPHRWATTTSPRDTIKSHGRKTGLMQGWGSLTEQFLSLLISEGPLERCRRPKMSARSKNPICLSTVGWLQVLKEWQHIASPSACFALSHVFSHTGGTGKAWSGQHFTAVQVVCTKRVAELEGGSHW